MPQVQFQQGEDVIVELPILEAGVPFDLTNASSIRVQAYITKNNVKSKVFAYSNSPKSGYGVCRQKTGDGSEHIIEVLVKRSESINFDPGVLSFAAVVTMPGGTDFPAGKNSEYNFDNLGTVLPGEAKDEIIP